MGDNKERILEIINQRIKKEIVMTLVGLVVIVLALIIGFNIYNKPENRMKRALDLGQKYLLEEDYEQAVMEFHKVLEIDPKNVDAYLGIADAYVSLDDSDMAIKVLEEGYRATGENKAVRDYLVNLYMEIVERAIEEGSYEAGKKAYERIVELGGENAEFSKKLEELQGDRSEEEDIVQVDSQEEENLPYYELGFSPEDFTVAGYSVTDGDHLEDIGQVIAEIIPNWEDVWTDANYTGLAYEYYYDGAGISYGSSGYSTILYESGIEPGVILLRINQDNNIMDIPFWEGKVIPGITSYEDVLDILEIREIIQQTDAKEKSDYYEISELGESGFYEATFLFETQYGNTKCRCVYDEEECLISCRFFTEEWDMVLFVWNDVLDSIVIVCGLH